MAVGSMQSVPGPVIWRHVAGVEFGGTDDTRVRAVAESGPYNLRDLVVPTKRSPPSETIYDISNIG